MTFFDRTDLDLFYDLTAGHGAASSPARPAPIPDKKEVPEKTTPAQRKV